MTGGVSAAVSAQRSLGIELLEALLVRGNATVSPYLLALKIQRRTDAVITVSIVVGARISVLLVDVRRALTGLAGAHFRKIAFVGRFPAHDATREQLHFQNRSRLDLSRGSSTPKQWFRSVERKRNLDLPIYLPSSSLYTPSVRFHLSTRLLYSWLSGTYIFRQRGGRMEAWNVWRGTYPRCWSTIEIGKLRSERGEERRGEREEVECRRNILPYNRCSKGRSRIALRRWVCRWSDRSRGRTRDTPRSIRNHIALPRRLPCFRKISLLPPEKGGWKMRIFFDRLFVSWSRMNVDHAWSIHVKDIVKKRNGTIKWKIMGNKNWVTWKCGLRFSLHGKIEFLYVIMIQILSCEKDLKALIIF